MILLYLFGYKNVRKIYNPPLISTSFAASSASSTCWWSMASWSSWAKGFPAANLCFWRENHGLGAIFESWMDWEHWQFSITSTTLVNCTEIAGAQCRVCMFSLNVQDFQLLHYRTTTIIKSLSCVIRCSSIKNCLISSRKSTNQTNVYLDQKKIEVSHDVSFWCWDIAKRFGCISK